MRTGIQVIPLCRTVVEDIRSRDAGLRHPDVVKVARQRAVLDDALLPVDHESLWRTVRLRSMDIDAFDIRHRHRASVLPDGDNVDVMRHDDVAHPGILNAREFHKERIENPPPTNFGAPPDSSYVCGLP